MQTSESLETKEVTSTSEPKLLTPSVIAAIEHALEKVGPFGEVHLIVERGHLRFIRTIRSEAIDQPKS
jgi:hypothetical protein